MACRMIQSSDWDAGAKRGSTQESLTTRDMANLQNVNGGRHPGRASPPGDGKQRNKVHPPPRSGDRSQPGCESERVAVSAASRRSEEHTSELQSLMRISYAVFCLK